MKKLVFIITFLLISSYQCFSQNFWHATSYFPNYSGIYGNSFATDYISTGRINIGGHGNCGCIFRTFDGGNNWENIGSPSGTVLNMSIYPWTPNWLLAAVTTTGSSGTLYRYYNTTGGFVWGSVSSFEGKNVRTVLAKNYLFTGVAGDPGSRGIWICYNSEGTVWSCVEPNYEIYCLYTKNGKYYAGGYNPNPANGILLKSDNLGISWYPIADFPHRVVGITVADSNKIFVAWGLSNSGNISVSINGAPFEVVYGNDQIFFSNDKLPIISNNLGHVFFAGRLQGVYRSVNYGSNWELINAGLSNNCVTDLHIAPDQYLYAAHECGLMEFVDKSIEPTNILSAPTITPSSGVFPPNFNVSITSISYPPVDIRYTMDGSDPDINSTLYTSPILISGNTNIKLKARVFRTGFNPSDTSTATYYCLQSPSLQSPVNGSTGISVTPFFQWTNTDALSYRLQVSTDSTFNTNLRINDSTITVNYFQVIDSLECLTKYYWRVNAKYSGGTSSFSDTIFNFTTIVSPPIPPVLLSPANNSIDNPLLVSFLWSKPQNAHTYRLQVARDSLFSDLFYNDSTITDTTKIVSGLSYNTKYWWRVKAKSDGGWGDYSDPVFSFKTIINIPNPPALVSPPNNSVNQPLSLNLVWNKSESVTFYKLLLAKDSLFTIIVLNDTTLTDTIKSISGLTYSTKYWWKVAAKNSNGSSQYSGSYNFRTLSKPCTVTWQAKITANDAGTGNDSLFFGKSPDATNGLDTCLGEAAYPPVPPTGIFDYRFILPTNPVIASKRDYRNDAIDTIVWKMTFQVSSAGYPVTFTWNSAELPVGTFYLKDDITGTIINVNMKTQNSYVLVYAGITSLKIESVSASVPGAPMLLQPDNNAVNVSLTPLMDWSDVSNALTYRIQVSPDSMFTTTQFDTSGITTSQITIPSGKLAGFTKYYWRVNASNSNGTGQWSEKRNFTTFQSMTLNLKVYLEGFWNGSTHISDTVNAYLAGSTSPYAFADSQIVILSGSGTSNVLFTKASSGSYYIVIKHRNHLETWSALPQAINSGTPISYDFTTAQSQAYGNNLIYSNGAWCIFGGDVTGDGFVDGSDMALLDNDLFNYASGYILTDINGDQFVDGADMAILDNNLFNYISVVRPGSIDAIRKNIFLKSEQERNNTIWEIKIKKN